MRLKMILMATVLAVLVACGGQSSALPTSNPREEELKQWLMKVITWYKNDDGNFLLDIAWDKEEMPYMKGKAETMDWLASSNYFTEKFLDRKRLFLDRCEKDAGADLDMDRYDCLDRDLLVGQYFDTYSSLDSLSIEKKAGALLVSFTLVGYRQFAESDREPRSNRLKYRIIEVDSTWKIDQTGTVTDEGDWELHWE